MAGIGRLKKEYREDFTLEEYEAWAKKVSGHKTKMVCLLLSGYAMMLPTIIALARDDFGGSRFDRSFLAVNQFVPVSVRGFYRLLFRA